MGGWRDLKNRTSRRRGRGGFDVAVEERDGREAPPSKLGGTDDNDQGTPPHPPMGRVGQVGRVGRLGEGQQADDSKVGGRREKPT